MTDEEQKIVFAENLRFYIDRTGKQQKEIAKDLRISTSTLNTWVKAKAIPNVAKIQVLPMTIGEAIEKYIMGISASASPATLRTYRNVQKYYVSGIEPYMADTVKSDDLQAWINALSQKYSAKTVAIAVKVVAASIKAVRPNFRMSAKLPQGNADIVLIPTKDEVKKLIGIASKRMRRAIMLGAYCGMRRGEISFFRYRDIKDGCIIIHGDVVPTPGGEWQFKETAKTDKSNRTIRVPDFVLQELGQDKPD